jgi:4-carboxymuconolactone decarboxylase
MRIMAVLSCTLIATLVARTVAGQERLAAVPPTAYTPEQQQVVAQVAAGPRTEMFSPLLPMLRSPQLAYTAERFGEYVYYSTAFDKRIYELAVLLLARFTTQQYEWRVHYPQAIKAGIRSEDADAIAAGHRPPHLAADETIAYNFIIELYDRNEVSDASYAQFIGAFGERGVVELVGLLGYYNTIALMMNVNRTPLNAGTTPLLPPLARPLP